MASQAARASCSRLAGSSRINRYTVRRDPLLEKRAAQGALRQQVDPTPEDALQSLGQVVVTIGDTGCIRRAKPDDEVHIALLRVEISPCGRAERVQAFHREASAGFRHLLAMGRYERVVSYADMSSVS